MRKPIVIDTHEAYATVSVGIVMGHQDYDVAEQILVDADKAMYAAKAEGRGRSTVFSNALAIHKS